MLLKSVLANFDQLKHLADVANDKNLLRKALLEIDYELLREVINVLNIFDEATRIVSADKVPTIHLVTAMRLKLLSHVAESEADSDPVRHLECQLKLFLTSHFRVSSLHNIALLLDPRQKSNRALMSAEERMASIAAIKAMVAKVEVAGVVDDSGSGAGIISSNCSNLYPCRSLYFIYIIYIACFQTLYIKFVHFLYILSIM